MPGQTEHECHKRRQCHKRRNLRNRFEMVKTLGQGTYGKVKLAIERETGEPFAIKSIKKKQIGTEQDLQRLRREIEIMTHLNHPYIISVHEVFENSDKIILVMEYASGGELYDYCNDKQGLYDDEARKFFRQIISAVHYLHMNGIVHRDLKLENIVLDYNGDCKIADFGFANICREDRLLSTFCGSPLYASPEIVNGLPYHGPEVDCWSLGVLLYAMVYGAMPFDGSDFRRLRNQITAGEYFTPSRPSDAEDLIARLLCPNANRRATIADISNHWWVNLGYKYNPVDDTLPGKPVDQKSLLVRLFSGSPVENDHNKNNNTGDDLMNWTRCSSSQFSRDHTSSPVKEILKFPKQSSQFGCGVSQVLCLQRSRSLDANINLTASWPMSSHKEDEEEKISMHNTNMAFDSHKLPKKSILKKQHSQPSDEHAASKITETLTLDNDLTACVASPCKLNKDICDEHSVDHSVLASDLDDADMAPDAEILTCYDLGDIEAVLDGLVENEVFSDIVVSPSVAANTMAEDSGIVRDISSAETPPTVPQKLESLSKDDSPLELAESDTVSGLPLSNTRKKGILKNKQNNPTWRYSVGSQDSSSSADILNFSYDSTEGENLFSEYFSMPLTLPMVSDDSLALEMAPMLNQFTEDEDEVLGPPPPLPSCPPPSYDGTSSHQENFCFPLKNDEIIEKILQLGNQDTLEPSTEVLSPRMVDWCEVNDIYRKALELHSEWS